MNQSIVCTQHAIFTDNPKQYNNMSSKPCYDIERWGTSRTTNHHLATQPPHEHPNHLFVACRSTRCIPMHNLAYRNSPPKSPKRLKAEPWTNRSHGTWALLDCGVSKVATVYVIDVVSARSYIYSTDLKSVLFRWSSFVSVSPHHTLSNIAVFPHLLHSICPCRHTN